MKPLTISILIALLCAGFSNRAHAQFGLPVVSITAPDAIAAEGGAPGHFLVHRNRALKSPLRVHLRVAGTAISAADYEAIPSSIVIPAGRSVAQISVRPIDDELAEGREKVTIHIVSPPGKKVYGIGAKSAAVVRIEDDDPDEPAEITVAPTVSGTVLHLVEINEWFIDDEPDLATYYYKQMHGREFSRAFMEFEIPALARHLVSATLMLTETTPVELVPTVHDILHYPADLELKTNDFYAPATLIGTFMTDPNIMGEPVNIEMTWSMRPYVGTNFGVRIQLGIDPNYQGPGWLGSRFADVRESYPYAPHLVLRTTQRPYVGFTSPSQTSSLSGPGNIVIKAVAVDQDGFVSGVSFWANGQKIGGQNAAEEPSQAGSGQRFSMTWVNVTPGTYVLEARTIDNEGAESASKPVTITVRGPCTNEVVVAPSVSGRIEFGPEVNNYQVNVNPAHSHVLFSVYHPPTGAGLTRIFERGFLEFEIPALPGGIAAATLLMQASAGSGTLPNFIDTHEVWAYPADLSIDVGDYDRGTMLAGRFQTEVSKGPEEYIAMDVTQLVKSFQAANLGLRIKLAIDPDTHDSNYHGDGFHSARIVIVTCP